MGKRLERNIGREKEPERVTGREERRLGDTRRETREKREKFKG